MKLLKSCTFIIGVNMFKSVNSIVKRALCFLGLKFIKIELVKIYFTINVLASLTCLPQESRI